MTTISHSAIGIIVAKYFIEQGLLPHHGLSPFTLGVIYSNIPDLDGLLSLRHLYEHHSRFKNLFHYPANWLMVIAFTAVVALPLHIPHIFAYIGLAALCIFLHFVLDTFSIYGGIAWLGPWNKKKFSFIKISPFIPDNNKEWVHWYLKHWIVYFEVALWISAALILIHQRV